LGACLQRLNKVTRHRQSFRRKAKAAIAMQKLSSFGIVGCSLLIGVIQISMNPDNFFKAWSHPLGGMLILFGLVLSSVGITWMLYLGRDKV
jgi:Flp pilus assembly protein TadB